MLPEAIAICQWLDKTGTADRQLQHQPLRRQQYTAPSDAGLVDPGLVEVRVRRLAELTAIIRQHLLTVHTSSDKEVAKTSGRRRPVSGLWSLCPCHQQADFADKGAVASTVDAGAAVPLEPDELAGALADRSGSEGGSSSSRSAVGRSSSASRPNCQGFGGSGGGGGGGNSSGGGAVSSGSGGGASAGSGGIGLLRSASGRIKSTFSRLQREGFAFRSLRRRGQQQQLHRQIMEPAQEQPPQITTKPCQQQDDDAGMEPGQRDSQCLDLVLERLQNELDGLRLHGYRTLPTKSNPGGGSGGGGSKRGNSGGWADDSDLMENIAELDQLLQVQEPPQTAATGASSASSSVAAAAASTSAISDEESAMAAALLESMSPFDGEPKSEKQQQEEDEEEEQKSSQEENGGLKRGTKFRWSSFARSHRPNVNQRELQISGMSVTQLRVLRTAACEEINKIVRQHCPPNKPLFTWGNQKPAKRTKSAASPTASPSIIPLPSQTPTSPSSPSSSPACRTAVFGMPLFTVQMRYGQPLPSAVVYLMRQLRQSGVSAHGIFRKAGGKARVSALRAEIDADPDKSDFSRCQPYDMADLVKAYLRELPECLITHKLSPTLLAIFSHVESDSIRLAAVQAAALLLPDENRQVLQALLYFLNDFADCSDTTQMTPSNLAVCLAPSLFYFPHQVAATTPSRFRRPGGGGGASSSGAPDPRDLEDHKAAAACLAFMIDCCHRMFTVPDDLYRRLSETRSEELEVPSLDAVAPLDPTGRRYCFAFVENHAQLVARETCSSSDKWVPFSHRSGIETFFKVVDDGHPLRLWKALVLIEADSTDVLNRIVMERETWDPDVLKSETLESLDETSDVIRLSLASPPAQPSRETCLLRAWRSASAHSHSVYSTSVRLPVSPLALSALILIEDWLVQSAGPGATRVTLLSRADLRGHSIEWYGATWGHAVARRLAHLKKSFQRKVPAGALQPFTR